MVKTALVLLSVAAAEDLCCYSGCGSKPAGCNNPGEWCASEANCGGCGGAWCPDAGPSPAPSPSPSPSPAPAPSGDVVEYCPDPEQDFQVEREPGAQGTVTWSDSGWSIQGWLRLSSKASFDFTNGGATWEMDLSQAHGGVNNNFYVTYPGEENCGINCYCDSGGSVAGCAELDWTENNGGCFQATTWHDDAAGGDHGGYGGNGGLSGGTIQCSAQYSADGSSVDITIGGNHANGNAQTAQMQSRGAVIYSSQWVGWVPGSCGGDGNLDASVYAVKNIRLKGRVVQGPEPRRCSAVESAVQV